MLKQFKFKTSSRNNLFFISDTHFNHEKIAPMRGFKTAEEHDEAIISAWNNKVRPADTVICLGDFIFKSNEQMATFYIERLNGNIYHLWGNHNSGTKQLYRSLVKNDDIEVYPAIFNRTTSLGSFIFAGDYLSGFVNDIPFVACHYPILSWDNMGKGAWHLFGHEHNRLKDTDWIKTNYIKGKCISVTIENIGLAPISFHEVKSYMDKQEIICVDHH